MNDIVLQPLVSPRAVGKSGRVLYAFSEFYLPCYGLDPAWLFFNYERFAVVSALVYQVDETAEADNDSKRLSAGIERLRKYLRREAVIDSQIEELIGNAADYYNFERNIRQDDITFSLEELRRVAQIRSFDFRIMHRCLAQRLLHEYDEKLFSWFRHFELLMEIEDDLQSIEQDELKKTFNFYYLAKRVCSSEVSLFLQCELVELRNAVVNEIGSLHFTLQPICRRVLTRYRQIVAEPQLPK